MAKPSPLLTTLADLDDQVFEQSPTALCVCRAPDGTITRYNAKAVQLWGRAPLPGQRLTGALRTWSAEDGRARGPGETAMEAVLHGGPAVHEEHAILERHDGSLVAVSGDVSPLQDPEGSLVGAISAFESAGRPPCAAATALTGVCGRAPESGDESRAASDSGHVLAPTLIGVWDYDLATRRALRSITHDQIYGYAAPLSEWTFDTFVQHVAPYHRDRIVAAFDQCLQGADATFDCRVTRGDGTPAWIWSRGRVVRARDGSPQRVVGLVMDVTRRMQVEQVLEDENRRHDAFIATLAHELRQPLSALLAGVELIDLVSDPAAVGRAATVMRRQIGRMSRLVDDIVVSERWARGKITLRKQRLDLAEVIDHALEDARSAAAARGVDLTLERGGPDPVWVDGDPPRLEQVFSNLLRNAVTYTEPGGRIGVTVERHAATVVVRIHDTGVGIAAEALPHVFERFSQVDAETSAGLGIGLSVVREIAVLHGGRIDARSEGRGEGSEFILTLPLAPGISL